MKVFISHSSTDKKFVKTLKEDLKENSFNTWVDEDEIDFGDKLIEKLELALEESSHFLIILSQTSVNSEWVKFELTKALKQNDTFLLQKIIPVKYNSCEVPDELKSLVYADLSNETRRVHGDKVFFVTDGYDNFLNKLCRTIRNSEQSLSHTDKRKIKKELENESIENTYKEKDKIIKAIYSVKGFKDIPSKIKYRNFILEGELSNQFKNAEEIKPILLPPLLKSTFQNLKLGQIIYFSKNYFFNEPGHFAGFRSDDLYLTIDPKIRKELSLIRDKKYDVEIDINNMRITFLDDM